MSEQKQKNEQVVLVEGVSFAYNGRLVLDNISLHINRLDFVSVVGPNGGGKTTLIKLLLGLLKPQQGRIAVFDSPPRKVRERVGYVPQYFQFDPRFPMRVTDFVLMGRLTSTGPWGGFRRADRLIAERALSEVELADYGGRQLAELSGGQRQRVMIARALASEPDLLFLDEPTAHIDPSAQKDLYRVMQQLNQRMTLVMVTHDASFVAPFVRSVLCVNKRAVMHPTSGITSEIISELYGADVRLVSHEKITKPHDDLCDRCEHGVFIPGKGNSESGTGTGVGDGGPIDV